jgi:hypothetical protein
VFAHAASERQDAKKTRMWIWLTIMLGGFFMGFKTYEYTTEILHGYTIFTSNFWSFYYTATGLHRIRRMRCRPTGAVGRCCCGSAKGDKWPRGEHRLCCRRCRHVHGVKCR